MQVIKCKMCGANLPVTQTGVIVQCDHCGTTQTIPKPDSEKKLSAFARANKLRMAGDFDKAAGVYESIVADYPEEAEAYWCLVLCKYGVEYVDDPATGKKVPTCHRSSYDSVLDDDDFEQALENSTPEVRAQYREEAKALEVLRRQIVEVSSKEEPYDIFISYKETDFNGERTLDSVLAQDIYQMLTKKGYRVFFSRISLKDHLGKQYEPYIFAALNSAKIMLVVGTDYEFFTAPWVKNEWSRYLQLIAKGDQKTLIPCYKNIDIDDMPREFGSLQAQNLGVVGYMQDLESGIEKILPLESQMSSVGAQAKSVATTDSYLVRAYQFLADGDFPKADQYAEKVLDIEPTNGKAHMCKLMVEFRVTREEALANVGTRLDLSKNYEKVLQFGDDAMRERVLSYEEAVYKRIGKRNAMLQEAEQKKQAVLAEVKRSKELVGKAEQKCKIIQAAINQKGQYLENLKQGIATLKQSLDTKSAMTKRKFYIPVWLMIPLAILLAFAALALTIGYKTDMIGGGILCMGLFVLMVIAAGAFSLTASLGVGLPAAAIFIDVVVILIMLFIGLWIEHGGPFAFLGVMLDNVLFALFGENNKIFTTTVWSVTWSFSSVVFSIAGVIASGISGWMRFAAKREIKKVKKQIEAKTAEYDAKVQNDVELHALHEDLKNAQAEYSSTLGSCRNAIHQTYNEYHRMMNACNVRAEALIPKEFE